MSRYIEIESCVNCPFLLVRHNSGYTPSCPGTYCTNQIGEDRLLDPNTYATPLEIPKWCPLPVLEGKK